MSNTSRHHHGDDWETRGFIECALCGRICRPRQGAPTQPTAHQRGGTRCLGWGIPGVSRERRDNHGRSVAVDPVVGEGTDGLRAQLRDLQALVAAQAAQLETVRQENQDLIKENNEFRDHLLTQSALVDALTKERDELSARVASLEAGAAPTVRVPLDLLNEAIHELKGERSPVADDLLAIRDHGLKAWGDSLKALTNEHGEWTPPDGEP